MGVVSGETALRVRKKLTGHDFRSRRAAAIATPAWTLSAGRQAPGPSATCARLAAPAPRYAECAAELA